MKKLIFVLIAALGVSCTSYAQMTDKELKKATKAAQKVVKEAKDEMEREDVADKRGAKRLIDKAMKDPLLQDWDQTWYEAAVIYEYFYNDENVKYYNGKSDTVTMYNYLLDWFKYALKADSLQMIPNEKGKVNYEARKTMIPRVQRNLSNLINAGIFYFNHRSDFATAYKLFDQYYQMAQSEPFAELMAEDQTWKTYKDQWAYFPTLCAMSLENWENCLKYAQIAKNDSTYGPDATELICESYANLGDTVKWLDALKEGLYKYPTREYYYGKLLNYYSNKNDMEALEKFVTDMIEVDPEKSWNYYVLGFIAQSNKNYDEAVKQYKIAVEKNPKFADAYFNLGLCIVNQALDFMDSKSNLDYRSSAFKKAQEEEKNYYREALPYFEKLRELEPDSPRKWGIGLQQCYSKLNMAKQLDEIEARMKEAGLL
jgi:Tfp pilus assembly protein PilF